MNELKPCPFCGNVNINVYSAREIDDLPHIGLSYACLCNCHIGGCGATGGYRITEDEAIEAWNRRIEK